MDAENANKKIIDKTPETDQESQMTTYQGIEIGPTSDSGNSIESDNKETASTDIKVVYKPSIGRRIALIVLYIITLPCLVFTALLLNAPGGIGLGIIVLMAILPVLIVSIISIIVLHSINISSKRRFENNSKLGIIEDEYTFHTEADKINKLHRIAAVYAGTPFALIVILAMPIALRLMNFQIDDVTRSIIFIIEIGSMGILPLLWPLLGIYFTIRTRSIKGAEHSAQKNKLTIMFMSWIL